MSTIIDSRHPDYKAKYQDWEKWRLTYEGGCNFIEAYLKKFSKLESPEDFATRKEISYCPAFSKAAVNEVKNSIFQRTADVTREGGPVSYQEAVEGRINGVDLCGSSMNSFIGRKILPELLPMGKVGLYVDMPPLPGYTVADKGNRRPYIYSYIAENILNWSYDQSDKPNEFNALLLRDYVFKNYEGTELPECMVTRYRYFWLENGQVYVQFYNDDGQRTDLLGNPSFEPIRLPLKRIPFVVFEITESLLADVADYQIAYLNLASSDISYSLQSNFPFYTEQYDPRAENIFNLVAQDREATGSASEVVASNNKVEIGTTHGRRYPLGMERPGFVNPSAEPLRVSMEKQEKLKADIRQLVNLAVTNLQPKMASAESKNFDNQGLESGLSYIGLEVETGERLIADYWAMYEGAVPATVNYPTNYSLKSDEDRRKEADSLSEIASKVPSATFQKTVARKIAEITVGSKISNQELNKIRTEIDAAESNTCDSEIITRDVELGILPKIYAAKLKGYPDDSVEKAEEEHAERLAAIAEAQTAKNQAAGLPNASARGVQDADPAPKIKKTTGKE